MDKLRHIWRFLTNSRYRNSDYMREYQQGVDRIFNEMQDMRSRQVVGPFVVGEKLKEKLVKEWPELFN